MAAKKVLITGACGLIGHSLYLHLREQGERYEVYALDRNRELSDRVPAGTVLDIPGDQFFECDLADMASMEKAVTGMDVVVHLAADASGRGGWESLLHNNLIGVYTVFDVCRAAGVSRIVAASSIQVSTGHCETDPYKAITEGRYGDVPDDFPKITSDTPAEPRTLYGATKVWTESLAKVYAHTHGMSCLVIRAGWVVADDEPGARGHHIWCSQRDMVQLIECCINAGDEVRFEIFYGMSDNKWRWVDIEDARRKVGYVPQDRDEESS